MGVLSKIITTGVKQAVKPTRKSLGAKTDDMMLEPDVPVELPVVPTIDEGIDVGKSVLPTNAKKIENEIFKSENIKNWQSQNDIEDIIKAKDVVKEPLKKQANLLIEDKEGKIKNVDQLMNFRKAVDEIQPYSFQERIPEVIDFQGIVASLSGKIPSESALKKIKDRGLIGLNKKIKTGTKVGSRFDITAYRKYGAYHATLQSPKGGSNVLGYARTVYLKDVDLTVDSKKAILIAKGKNKSPFILMKGKYQDHDSNKLRDYAESIFNNPEWSQLSVNPAKAGTFVKVAKLPDGTIQSTPVTGADEVIQIGKMVLAKNAKTIPWEEYYKAGNFNEGGNVKDQTKKLLQEGGLNQEGGTVDPVSGNDVPVGSTQEEVRDDIPAQLSEGEFVFPADVVRFIGLDNLMKLRQEAKAGLAKMDRMGQMGNSEEAVEDDTGEFDTDIDDIIGEIEREARMAQPEEEKTVQ